MTRFYLRLMTAATALITLCFSLSAQEKVVPGKGDIEVTDFKGVQLGVWRPDTRVFVFAQLHKTGDRAGQHLSYSFRDDGQIYTDTGSHIGTISESGTMSCLADGWLKDIRVSTFYILRKGTEIGQISDLGIVTIYGQKTFRSSAPMDKNVLCFVTVCSLYTEENLAALKKASDNRAQQEAANRPKPTVGRNATKLEIVGGEVKACDAKGVWIGSAKKESDGRIYIYTAKSTGPVGCLNNGYIDFRGFSNYLTYSYTETTDTYTFNSEKGLPIVDVEHNSGSRNYEVRDRATRKLIGTFPDTIDARFGALLIFGFFDK